MFHSFAQDSSSSLQYVGGHSWNFNFNFTPTSETVYDNGGKGESVCYAETLGMNEEAINSSTAYQIEQVIRDTFGDQTIHLVKITRTKNFVWGNYSYSFILAGGNFETSTRKVLAK